MKLTKRANKETMRITREQLKELVEEPFFSQGERCFQEGMLELLDIEEDRVSARAMGAKCCFSSIYREYGELAGDCTCTFYTMYDSCKHIAATGLALMAHNQAGYRPSKTYEEQTEFFTGAYRLLSQQSKDTLVTLLMDVINEDPKKILWFEEEGDKLLAESDFWV